MTIKDPLLKNFKVLHKMALNENFSVINVRIEIQNNFLKQ